MTESKLFQFATTYQSFEDRARRQIEIDFKKRTWKFKLLEPRHLDQETLLKNQKLKSVIYWYDEINNYLEGAIQLTYQATADQARDALRFNGGSSMLFEVIKSDEEWRNVIKPYKNKVGHVFIKEHQTLDVFPNIIHREIIPENDSKTSDDVNKTISYKVIFDQHYEETCQALNYLVSKTIVTLSTQSADKLENLLEREPSNALCDSFIDSVIKDVIAKKTSMDKLARRN
jgi:hypothetical protein